MVVRPTRLSRYGAVAFVVSVAAAVVAWPRLPAEMAIHFSAAGTPDGYVPKAVGVALLPAIMLGTLAVLRWSYRVDTPENRRVVTVVTIATLGLLLALHGLVIAWNLGYSVPFDLVLVGCFAWAGALVAYALAEEYGWLT
jgi:uncharacterized membrane protein